MTLAEYFTLQEVAAELHIAYTGLYKWIQDGILQPTQLGNRKVYAKSHIEVVVKAFNEEKRSYVKLLEKREDYGL